METIRWTQLPIERRLRIIRALDLSRANLDVAFDDSGRQINPLIARQSGNVAGVMTLLERCGWQAEPERDVFECRLYSLKAQQGDQVALAH